jgi:hypothetical protein
MAESTLTLGYGDLASEVALYLGYGTDYTAWSTNQTAEVDRIVQTGYRRFLTASVAAKPYLWSFLTPDTTLTIWPTTTAKVSGAPTYDGVAYSTVTATTAVFYPTMPGKAFVFATSGTSYTIHGYTSATVITVTGNASGETSGDSFTITADGNYDCPDDFGGMYGRFNFGADQAWSPIEERACNQISALRTGYTGTSAPRYFAVQVKPFVQTTGQRWEWMFFPAPDTAYTLNYMYNVLAQSLHRTLRPYPLGGMEHGETIKQCCLAQAELSQMRIAGDHCGLEQRMLAAAIRRDAERMGPKTLGRMGDPTGRNQGFPGGAQSYASYVTYNGTLYTK